MIGSSRVMGAERGVAPRPELGSLLSPGKCDSGWDSLVSCTYPGNALALLVKDGAALALASVTVPMLAGCPPNLDYSSMNTPFIPCAGLGDSAPSLESPSSKTSRDDGQAVLHPLGLVVFCHTSCVQNNRPHWKGNFTWSGDLCVRFLHRIMPTVSPGLAPPLLSQLSHPVTSSLAPCRPWILLMTEPQKKGTSVYRHTHLDLWRVGHRK